MLYIRKKLLVLSVSEKRVIHARLTWRNCMEYDKVIPYWIFMQKFRLKMHMCMQLEQYFTVGPGLQLALDAYCRYTQLARRGSTLSLTRWRLLSCNNPSRLWSWSDDLDTQWSQIYIFGKHIKIWESSACRSLSNTCIFDRGIKEFCLMLRFSTGLGTTWLIVRLRPCLTWCFLRA